MTIDPRVGLYFSIALAVIGALVGTSASMTDLFGAETAKIILGVLVLLNTIGNAINAVLHAIPSKPNHFDEFPLAPKALKEESKSA